MGRCVFCDQPAGLFKSRHEECEQKFKKASQAIRSSVTQLLRSDVDVNRFASTVIRGASANFISQTALKELYAAGVAECVEEALSDHLLTSSESARLVEMMNAFDLSALDLGPPGRKFHGALLLKTIDEGHVTELIASPSNDVPIRFEPGEGLLWTFFPATYYSSRSKTQYLGASQGVSIRLARGVYYRVGATRGEAVKADYLAIEGTGSLFVSNRAIYFLSQSKTVKVPASKIMAVQLFADSIQVSREGVNAKPLVFSVDDPAFAANLLARIA